MKNRAIKFAAYYLLTFLTAVLCVFVLYRFFPKYLCYSVYDVKESDSYALEEIQIQEGEAFELFFSPLNPYLKGVAIHIRKENTANNEYWEGTEASAAWYEGDKAVGHSKVHVKYNGYVEFPLEKWVDTEKTYRLSVVFDGDAGDKYYLMTGSK